MIRTALLLAAVLAALPNPAIADQTYYEALARAQKNAKRLKPFGFDLEYWKAESQGYADRVVDLGLCDDIGVVTTIDQVLKDKFTRKYRGARGYYDGYWTPDINLIGYKFQKQGRCAFAIGYAPWLSGVWPDRNNQDGK